MEGSLGAQVGKDRQRTRQAEALQMPAAATGDTAAAQEPGQADRPDAQAARPAAESGVGSDLASGVAAGDRGNATEHQDDAATRHGLEPQEHAFNDEARMHPEPHLHA